MLNFSRKLGIIIILSFGCGLIVAQEPIPLGSLEVSGRVSIGKERVKLQRKRFHLIRGGLEENKNLIEKLKTTEIVSRDCFYSQMKASPQFICWLKTENCESPYCREITDTDIDNVPEFKTAYQKGLRQFGRRSSIAQNWLTTNLQPNLRDGYYQQQKSLLRNLLNETKPLQSAMTDSVSVKAIFIDIPLNLTKSSGQKQESETFLISNILPFEIGDKSYIWACEVDIGTEKTARLSLKVPGEDKEIKGCEVIVKDLQVCKTEDCAK